MTTTSTTTPLESRKLAGASVAIFRHMRDGRLPRYSIKVVTSYYDEPSKAWKESCYFSDAQLAALAELQRWALSRTMDLREADQIHAQAETAKAAA